MSSTELAAAIQALNAVVNQDKKILGKADAEQLQLASKSINSLAETLTEHLIAADDGDDSEDLESGEPWPYTRLTRAHVEKVGDAFGNCDLDGTKDLNQAETIRLLTRFNIFSTFDEALAGIKIIDSDDSGRVTLPEILVYMDSIDEIFQDETHLNLKVGYSGTTWRKEGNIVWIMNNGIMIITVSVVFGALVYFAFVLVPMTMAYFLTFLLGPLLELFNARPLICCGRVNCGAKEYSDEEAQERWERKHAGKDFIERLPARDAYGFPAPTRCCNSLGWSQKQAPLHCPLGKGLQRLGGDFISVGKFPFGIALLGTLVGAFGLIYFITVAIAAQFKVLQMDDKFMDALLVLKDDIRSWLLNDYSIIVTELEPTVANYTETMSLSDIGEKAGPFVAIFNDVSVTLLLSLYMLMTRPNTSVEDFERLQEGPHRLSLMEKIEQCVSHYIVLKTKLSLFTGAAVGISLMLLRVRLWFVFGVLTFLFNYIPNVGSMIAMMLPLPIVLVTPEAELSVTEKLMAFFIPGCIQLYVGNFLEPQLFGQSLNLTAISVLIALVLWAFVWGICGAVLSVPLLGVMKILLDAADFPMAKGILRIIREDNSIDEGFERMKASKLGLMDLIPDSLVDTSEVLDLVGLHDGDVDTAEDIEDVRNVGNPISELEVFDNENDGKRLDQSQI